MYIRYKIGGDLSLAQNYWSNMSFYFENLANQVRSAPRQGFEKATKAISHVWHVEWV